MGIPAGSTNVPPRIVRLFHINKLKRLTYQMNMRKNKLFTNKNIYKHFKYLQDYPTDPIL